MPGVPAARRAAPALRAPHQQRGKAAATRGDLARDVVPGERSLAGLWWLLGLGGLCQLGSHMLQVFGSPLLRGVPGHLTEHVWLERLILDYLEARKSLHGGRGPVRIRAVPVQAGTAGLGWPQCQLGPSLQHHLELQRGAGYRPARLPAVLAGPNTTSWGVKGCVCSEVVPLGRQPHQEWKCSAGARAWGTNLAGCSSAGCAPSQHGAGGRDLDCTFMEVLGRDRWDEQAPLHGDNWQPAHAL